MKNNFITSCKVFHRKDRRRESEDMPATVPSTSGPVSGPGSTSASGESSPLTSAQIAELPIYGPETKYRKRRSLKKRTSKAFKSIGRGLVLAGAGVLGVIGTIIIAPLIIAGGALFVVITTVAGVVCCPCITVGTGIYAMAHKTKLISESGLAGIQARCGSK